MVIIMGDENKIRLLYEWNTRREKLDLAVKEAEHQLFSVNKRLEHLGQDVAFYGGIIALPPVLYSIIVLLVNDLHSRPLGGFPLIYLFVIFQYVLLCGYIIFLPFNIYYFLRSIKILRENRMPTEMMEEPPRAGALAGEQAMPERTCRAEQQKLVYILSRYYLNQESMDQLKRVLDSDSCTMTLPGLKRELDKLPFYEEVRPAAPTSDMSSGMRSFCFLVVFVALIVLVFRVW